MYKLISLCVVAVGCAGFAYADDSAEMPTMVRVYHVGNLVSAEATDAGSHFFGESTLEEWASQYPATIKALDELCEIVDTMCENKPIAIKSYVPSLSLVVRHTEDGHEEIAHLLQSLGETDRCSIQVEFRPVDFEKLDALAEADESNSLSLLMKRQLTAEQTTELLELLGPNEAHVESVTLKSGRRTSWGHAYLPRTVTGRVDHSTRRVALRIDFVTGDGEAVPPVYGTESLSLAAGESALFTHFYDGARMGWLVSARTLSQNNLPKAQP